MADDLTKKIGTRIAISPQVVFRQIDNETVLINLETERMFTLNSTGARFWQLLSEEYTLNEIGRQMQLEYDIDMSELEREIHELLHSLSEEGLISFE